MMSQQVHKFVQKKSINFLYIVILLLSRAILFNIIIIIESHKAQAAPSHFRSCEGIIMPCCHDNHKSLI